MVNEKTLLLEQAARCRRLAQAISDEELAEKLVVMAQGYEKAATVLSPPLVPSKVLRMTIPSQKDVERRAYQLWEEAGQPEGRDQEFYPRSRAAIEGRAHPPRTQDAR
jgi:hypothetical protein